MIVEVNQLYVSSINAKIIDIVMFHFKDDF